MPTSNSCENYEQMNFRIIMCMYLVSTSLDDVSEKINHHHEEVLIENNDADSDSCGNIYDNNSDILPSNFMLKNNVLNDDGDAVDYSEDVMDAPNVLNILSNAHTSDAEDRNSVQLDLPITSRNANNTRKKR